MEEETWYNFFQRGPALYTPPPFRACLLVAPNASLGNFAKALPLQAQTGFLLLRYSDQRFSVFLRPNLVTLEINVFLKTHFRIQHRAKVNCENLQFRVSESGTNVAQFVWDGWKLSVSRKNGF